MGASSPMRLRADPLPLVQSYSIYSTSGFRPVLGERRRLLRAISVPGRMLRLTGPVSLALHLLIGALLLVRVSLKLPADAPEQQVSLVWKQQQTSTDRTEPSAAQPVAQPQPAPRPAAPPVARSAPPPANRPVPAAPPPPAVPASNVPMPMPLSAPNAADTEAAAAAPPAPVAPPAPQPTETEPAPQTQAPSRQVSSQAAPETRLSDAEDETNGMVTGPQVVPAGIDAPENNRAPVYPVLAARYGEQGTVTLLVHVGVDGSARQVEIMETSGFERLDHAALAAVAKWHFRPAQQGGVPIESQFPVHVQFTLGK